MWKKNGRDGSDFIDVCFKIYVSLRGCCVASVRLLKAQRMTCGLSSVRLVSVTYLMTGVGWTSS